MNDFSLINVESFKKKFLLDSNQIITKCLMVDLPDNEKGILVLIYERDMVQDEHGKSISKFTIKSPITKLDGTLYSNDYFKFGSFLQYEHTIVEVARDIDALYIAFSYGEKKPHARPYGFDNYNKKLTVLKYKFPNFELEWKTDFYDKSVQSISVNDEEVALFDMASGEVIFLDKLTGIKNEKTIFKRTKSNHINKNLGISLESSNCAHHDIAFLGKKVVTMSYFNTITIYDENLEEMQMMSINQSNSLAEYFKNGGRMTNPQADMINNRLYFLSKKNLVVMTSNGIEKLSINSSSISGITFNPKDGSLLLEMDGKDNSVNIELISAHDIDRILGSSQSIDMQKKLLPSKH
jgi:hypothetical protein